MTLWRWPTMRDITSQQLREEARSFARQHVEHLISLNNDQLRSRHYEPNIRPFIEPEQMVPVFEQMYMRFVARNRVVSP